MSCNVLANVTIWAVACYTKGIDNNSFTGNEYVCAGPVPGARREPFNFTPMGVNPISPGSPHVRPMGRTCGEPDEVKKIPT